MPTITSFAFTSSTAPLAPMTRAVGGAIAIRASTARRARFTLHDSSASDTANRNVTTAASNHSPIAAAPITAIAISKFMSGRSCRTAPIARGTMNQPPHTMAVTYSTTESVGTLPSARPVPSEPSAPSAPANIAWYPNADSVRTPDAAVRTARCRRSQKLPLAFGLSSRQISARMPVRFTASAI